MSFCLRCGIWRGNGACWCDGMWTYPTDKQPAAALASGDDVQARPPECEALDCSAAPITQFGEWWFCEMHGDALGAGDVPTKRPPALGLLKLNAVPHPPARPPEVTT